MSESAEAKCDPFLQILEPMVRKLLADKDDWEAEDWDEDAFQGFFCEIALWLKNEKKEKSRVVAKTVAGLISYGVTTEEDLQIIADNKKEFRETFSAKDIPEAICDLLFEKYVSRKQRRVETEYALGESFDAQGFNTLISNGINIDKFHLERKLLVDKVIQLTFEKEFLVIGSAPATGKTALLQLVMVALNASETVKVCYMRGCGGGTESMLSALHRCSGIDLLNKEATAVAISPYESVWVLIDDAQKAYDEASYVFWEELVKGRHARLGSCGKKLRFVIAATYYLRTLGSPVAFKSEEHLSNDDLVMTDDEADALFASAAERGNWGDWEDFKTEMKAISNGHIGVFVQGLRLVQREHMTVMGRSDNTFCTEELALGLLRSGKFFDRLERCFVHPSKFDIGHRGLVLDAILFGELLSQPGRDAMEVDDEVPIVIMLVRGGVLASSGAFTCKAAEWYYYNRIFPGRAITAPHSIEDLVLSSVRSMSATRLKATCHDGFPKEAAFQQLFNEAMSRHLPRRNIIIPELNTRAIVGEEEEDGELDFYINGELQWAIELLRNGDKLGEHMKRFHPTSGKYRNVPARSYLVVDCRGPRMRSVQRMEARCTLYFSEDFKSCICEMRNDPEVQLELQA